MKKVADSRKKSSFRWKISWQRLLDWLYWEHMFGMFSLFDWGDRFIALNWLKRELQVLSESKQLREELNIYFDVNDSFFTYFYLRDLLFYLFQVAILIDLN